MHTQLSLFPYFTSCYQRNVNRFINIYKLFCQTSYLWNKWCLLNKILQNSQTYNPYWLSTLEHVGKGDQSQDYRNQSAIQPGCSVARLSRTFRPACPVAQVSRADTGFWYRILKRRVFPTKLAHSWLAPTDSLYVLNKRYNSVMSLHNYWFWLFINSNN